MPVSSFKEKIANETGVPVGQQRLIFRGKVLKDEHLISEYRILPFHGFCFPILMHLIVLHRKTRISITFVLATIVKF